LHSLHSSRRVTFLVVLAWRGHGTSDKTWKGRGTIPC